MIPTRTDRPAGTARGSRYYFFAGAAAGFGLAFVLLFLAVLLYLSVAGLLMGGRPTAGAAEGLPRYTLEVASDGCGVIRSDPPDPPKMLTWTVTDGEGFQVLGRLAESETRYRYYVAGDYGVVLRASDDEKYVDVSNRVSIRCP